MANPNSKYNILMTMTTSFPYVIVDTGMSMVREGQQAGYLTPLPRLVKAG